MTVFALVLTSLCYFISNIYQNKFSESLKGRRYPLPMFNGLWMVITATLLFVYKLFAGEFRFSGATLMIAAFSGVFIALSSMMLVLALGSGPMSLTILLFSVNSVIPTLLSVFVLNEKITIFQVIGMLLILLVCILINLNRGDLGLKIEKRWFLYTLLALVFTGANGFCTKLHQTKLPNLEQIEYSIVLFACGALIEIIFFVFLHWQDKLKGTERYVCRFSYFYLPIVIIAIVQGTAMLCQLYDSSRIPAVILFPVMQLLILMMTTVFSIFRLGERPKKKTVYCMVLGMVAIILMNF